MLNVHSIVNIIVLNHLVCNQFLMRNGCVSVYIETMKLMPLLFTTGLQIHLCVRYICLQVDIFSFQNDAILSRNLVITSREIQIEIEQKEEHGSHWRTVMEREIEVKESLLSS